MEYDVGFYTLEHLEHGCLIQKVAFLPRRRDELRGSQPVKGGD
jgi:hypothetical protein